MDYPKCIVQPRRKNSSVYKGLKGYVHQGANLIWPPLEPKTESSFHQFNPIGLLEEWSKCKILALIFTFSVAMVTKMADKIGLK